MPTVEELKDLGNKYYKQGDTQSAIESYSKAIKMDPNVATLYTNRALCHNMKQNYEKAVSDCRKAIDIDATNIKAHYFLGQAFVEIQQFDEAIIAFTKANELAQQRKISYGDDITKAIREASRAKYRWEEKHKEREENELESYLTNLIDQDLVRKLEYNQLEEEKDENYEVGFKEFMLRNPGFTPPSNKIRPSDQDLKNEAQRRKNQLHNHFQQIYAERNNREIPDYLCGKISLELLKDPVITPSGITYDRSDILDHLKQVGHFDPVSRAILTEKDLIPNLAMREVLEHFLAKNEWARYEIDK